MLDARNSLRVDPDNGVHTHLHLMPNPSTTMHATEVRQHLMLLHEERVLAHEAGLDHDRAYMADLDDEIAAYRAAYVGAAVTEIALLRASLDGRNQG
jgi:hypothetical protein